MKFLHSMPFGRILLLGCLAFAIPVQAALIANSAVVYDEGNFNGSFTINGTTGSTSAAGYNSTIVPGLATSGFASVSYGALHASAFSGASNAGLGQTTQTRGQGSAFWSDQVTYASTTLTGPAYAHALFSLSGGLNSLSDPGATGNSTIAARITVNGNTVFSTSGQLVSQSGSIAINDVRRGQSVNGVINTERVTDLTGIFSFDIPFEFNVPFQMTSSLDAFTQALSGGPGAVASAHSNFGSSGLWGGISEVHRADGTVLSGYSLSSVSGFDWANAFPSASPVSTVPVPGTLWLLGAGLLCLIGVGRHRKTS